MPASTLFSGPAEIDTTAIEHLLTDPDLHADHLPGETAEEHAARTTAAADITATLLDELAEPMADHPDGLEAGIQAASATIREWVDAYADYVHDLVDGADEAMGRWAA